MATVTVTEHGTSNSTSVDSAWEGHLLKYLAYDLWEIGGDPRVRQFPLMAGGPWIMLGILAFYLYFVKKLGPQMMKGRPPFDLKMIIFLYNITMMSVNWYFFVVSATYTRLGIRTWGCTMVNPSHWDEDMKWKLNMVWLFFITKFIDLLETIFFVLRKKDNQISFLHVFHHSIVPLDVWVGFKYSPSESASFFPLINSFVHAVMYLYYALTTLGPRVRPYLWWKKYLTQLQIVQLVLVAIHCFHLVLVPNCNIPKAIFAIYFPQVILLVYLFSSFFIKSYLKSSLASVKLD